MVLFQHDIKHLCEFWDISRKDEKYVDDWRFHITADQKINWPVEKKLRQQQLAIDHDNYIKLLIEDGYDNNPVFNGKWSAVKKYLETSGWPSVITLLRCSEFFHLNILQSLILCLKTSFEKEILNLPDSSIENVAKMLFAVDTIDHMTHVFINNIDKIKFKLDVRDFRDVEDLYLLLKEFYPVINEPDKFRDLIKDILMEKLHLESIFSRKTRDFLGNWHHLDIRKQGELKEKSAFIVLKIQWADRRLELADKVNELNRLLEGYGIMVKEWSKNIELPYNYFIKTNKIVQKLHDASVLKGKKSAITGYTDDDSMARKSLIRLDVTKITANLDSKIRKLYADSMVGSSLPLFDSIASGNSILAFSEQPVDELLKIKLIPDSAFPGKNLEEKMIHAQQEIEILDKVLTVVESQIETVIKAEHYKIVKLQAGNPEFYRKQFLNIAHENLQTAMKLCTSQNENVISSAEFEEINALSKIILEEKGKE